MNRRINDLAEVAVMLNETGVPAEDSVKLSVHISEVKGFQYEIKVNDT